MVFLLRAPDRPHPDPYFSNLYVDHGLWTQLLLCLGGIILIWSWLLFYVTGGLFFFFFFQLSIWMGLEYFSPVITFHHLGWYVLQKAAPIYQGRLHYCSQILIASPGGRIMSSYPMETGPSHVAWL